MRKNETPKTARTYRLTNPLIAALERVRKSMRIQPSETALVEAALWDFVKREEGETKRQEARR